MQPAEKEAFPARGLDALPPAEMARKAEDVGVAKAGMDAEKVFVLAVLAGAFIAMGAIFATTTMAGSEALPYGVERLLGGLTFSLGLILVVVAGAELFTGNNLVVMAQVGAGLSMRTNRESVFSIGLSSNRFLLWGIAFEIALAALLGYAPGLSDAFHMRGLSGWEWLFLLVWPPLILAAEDARKAVVRRLPARRRSG